MVSQNAVVKLTVEDKTFDLHAVNGLKGRYDWNDANGRLKHTLYMTLKSGRNVFFCLPKYTGSRVFVSLK